MEHRTRLTTFAIVTFFLGFFVYSSLLSDNKQAVVVVAAVSSDEGATSYPAIESNGAQWTSIPVPVMTPPGSSSTSEPQRAYWNYSVLRDAIEFQHLTMRTKCSDKCTAHRYQEIYARTLVHFRESTQPSKLLEIGLGCHYHQCSLGGPLTFMPFLPRTTYHTLEIEIFVCEAKYAANNVSLELSTYIDEHACHGSSDDVATVNACSAKFGPFDIVIDDGSHFD